MSPERQASAQARTKEMLVEIALQDLRKSLGFTEEQMAEAIQRNQATASKMDHQSDIYVSTLKKFIEALGGHIKIVASFPDREVVINQTDLLRSISCATVLPNIIDWP